MNGTTQRGKLRGNLGSVLVRSAKMAVVVLGMILALIAFAIWVGGDPSTLPFDYDGFD